jgi:hypothetical protein
MRQALLAVLFLPAACKTLPDIGDLKKLLPVVRFERLAIEEIDFRALDAKFVLEVDNPYPVALSLTETSWNLGLVGHPFLDGRNPDGTTIDANGTSKVRIPFSMKFADALAVAGEASGEDELPYTLDATLGFATPAGPVSVPLSHEGGLPALRLPRFTLRGLRVERLDLAEGVASLALDLDVDTDQPSALSFETFGYVLSVAGAEVAAGNAKIGQVAGHADVSLPVVVSLGGVSEAVLAILSEQRTTKVRLEADATVGTPFGPVPLHVSEIADLTPR